MPGPTRPKRTYEFLHAVSDEQLTALGRIVVEGSELEDVIEWAIWGMLGVTVETGQLFTTRQNFEAKVKTFTRVAQKNISDPALRQKAADVAARMKDSSGRRNDVVHAVWPPCGSGIAISRKLVDKGARQDRITADAGTLQQIAADLRADRDDLLRFLVAARINPPPSEGPSIGDAPEA